MDLNDDRGHDSADIAINTVIVSGELI